jgi:hypothetical protein
MHFTPWLAEPANLQFKSVNLSDESDWPNQAAWLLQHLEDFYRVFGPRVRKL